jgi:hypothetical protein
MLNLLVETKNEYTTHLINILTPLIFEGLQSIYKEAQEISSTNDILKIFQSFLKRIPKWNQTLIEKETHRIINSSQSYEWLNDLIKATLKANLVVLLYNPTIKNQHKNQSSYYQAIKTSDFVHRVYIECAREIWNNPYLMFHNYPPIEIKRNQRDCMAIIKDCIKESLRKMLPVKHILQIYLGEDMEVNNSDDHFEKAMSDVEERNLTKLIHKDLSNNKLEYKQSNKYDSDATAPSQLGSQIKQSTNTEEKTIGSRILNIINENSATSSDMTSVLRTSQKDTSKTSKQDISTSDIANTIAESIKKFEDTVSKTDTKPPIPTVHDVNQKILPKKQGVSNETFDDKIKKILKKDLATDSELETSINYNHDNNKYQEIFSNSHIETKANTTNNNLDKNKNNFFSNYLNN